MKPPFLEIRIEQPLDRFNLQLEIESNAAVLGIFGHYVTLIEVNKEWDHIDIPPSTAKT